MTYVYEPNLKKRLGSSTADVFEDQTLWRYDVPTQSDVLVSTSNRQVTNEENWKCGWDIPNYHRRVRSGELMPHTPWQRSDWFGSSSGSYNVVSSGGTSHWWSPDNWTPYTDWVVTQDQIWSHAPEAYDMYVTEAASKIYSTGHDTLTFLAELASVKRLFVGSAKKLLTMKIPRNWKEVSCDWLSVRYGWRTLMYDITSLNDAIRGLSKPKRTRYSERSGKTYHYETSNYTEIEKTHYWLDQTVVDKVRVSIRGSVTADIDVPAFQFNPLQTGWELIPFSFVLDWFFNVGRTLSAYSFMTLQKNYAASSGFRVELERSFDSTIGRTKPTYTSGTDDQTGSSVVSLEFRRPCRVPLTPRFILRLNTLKVFDLMALVTQRIH